jgi:hypothetical protein
VTFRFFSLIALPFIAPLAHAADSASVSKPDIVEGWTLLTSEPHVAADAIKASAAYGINHLQLSHDLMMNLHEARDPAVAERINGLADKAHAAGIGEVCVWDHALYHADYYPERFRSAPGGLIDLDNAEFWEWLKEDYRQMLDLLPKIDGVILTFIETGTFVEDQYSTQMTTEAEKLAALVNAVASVIIDERDLNLYIRTFVYTRAELDSMLGCINLISNPKIRVMTKEVPHDFFLTHPVATFVSRIKFPVLVEFDAAHEFNGQTVVASGFPAIHLERLNYYKQLPNFMGYVARIDRFGETTVVGDMAEINLHALHLGLKNEKVDLSDIYSSFVARQYGPDEDKLIQRAMEAAAEVVPSTFYTLGLCLSFHSRIDFNNRYAYQRHVSGKWMDNPVIHIGHGIDREFHYWKDIVNNLAEPQFKANDGKTILSVESPWVFEYDWLEATENMNETYLRYVVQEKDYAVQKAEEALVLVEEAISSRSEPGEALLKLRDTLKRTALSAHLYRGASKIYFSYRVYARGDEHRTPYVEQTLEEGLDETYKTSFAMLEHPDAGPLGGQYTWKEDPCRALAFYNAVKFRDSDTYSPDFFPTFSFRRLSPEREAEIIKKARQ